MTRWYHWIPHVATEDFSASDALNILGLSPHQKWRVTYLRWGSFCLSLYAEPIE